MQSEFVIREQGIFVFVRAIDENFLSLKHFASQETKKADKHNFYDNDISKIHGLILFDKLSCQNHTINDHFGDSCQEKSLNAHVPKSYRGFRQASSSAYIPDINFISDLETMCLNSLWG